MKQLVMQAEPTIKNGCEVGSGHSKRGHVPLKHLLTYYRYKLIDDSDQSADSSTSVFFLPKTTSKFLELSPLKLILRDIWSRGVILGRRSMCGILSGRLVSHVAEADHMYAKCPPVCHLASTQNHLLMGVHCSIVTHHLTLQAFKQTENHHHHHHHRKAISIGENLHQTQR